MVHSQLGSREISQKAGGISCFGSACRLVGHGWDPEALGSFRESNVAGVSYIVSPWFSSLVRKEINPHSKTCGKTTGE